MVLLLCTEQSPSEFHLNKSVMLWQFMLWTSFDWKTELSCIAVTTHVSVCNPCRLTEFLQMMQSHLLEHSVQNKIGAHSTCYRLCWGHMDLYHYGYSRNGIVTVMEDTIIKFI